jgi:viroplasmin and RNaseH domain-containing protein
MNITQPFIDRLTAYYAVAHGVTPGIFETYEEVKKLTEGFSKSKQRRFTYGPDAVRWLAEKLSESAEARTLNPDEQETLDSCKKLISEWPKEIVWPSLI